MQEASKSYNRKLCIGINVPLGEYRYQLFGRDCCHSPALRGVVFCHDDLSMASGPVFRPEFYESYIFSRYEWIMAPAVEAGKKIVFVADGNLDAFLERLLEFPFAGIMCECPATPYERVLATWGEAGRGFIGGISTPLLTRGTPRQVRDHTRSVMEIGKRYPGFIVGSCGQLPGNIPMENMLAYFETRNEMGCPAQL